MVDQHPVVVYPSVMRRTETTKETTTMTHTTKTRLEAHAQDCREALAAGRARPTLPVDLRDLREAYLRGVNLSEAYLSGVNLSGADLSEVNLSEANLRGVNLSGADLSEANLRGVNLYEADLYCVNLSGADLREATYGHTTAERTDTTHYPAWRLGPWLAYGRETYRADDDAAWAEAHALHDEPEAAAECEALRAAILADGGAS